MALLYYIYDLITKTLQKSRKGHPCQKIMPEKGTLTKIMSEKGTLAKIMSEKDQLTLG